MSDLLQLTASLVDIASVSHNELAITDFLEARLAESPWLSVTRVGENLVARTDLGHSRRLMIAGHTDTVPPNANEAARLEAGACWGIGSCDMKGGIAVMAELAATVAEPDLDVTYVFYECEEIDSRFNGVERLFRERPELMVADAVVVAEPTGAVVEAGCQGTLRAEVTATGTRAHSARGWLGINAIHRLAPVLTTVAAYRPREVEIDGCHYREGLQAVRVGGGVANNVVPDHASLTLNHRFAPDRTAAEAAEHVRSVVGEVDGFEVVDSAPSARPFLDHPLLRSVVEATGQPPRAKLGWTDVARFSARGLPATNYGPGDPNLAHHADEHVTGVDLDTTYGVLRRLLGS